jgi:type I restriction enzyme, S subunit
VKNEELEFNNELPTGWIECKLDDVFYIVFGQSPESSSYNDQGKGLPFFQGKAEFQAVYPEIKKYCTKPKKIAHKKSVLLSLRAPVGPTNLAPIKCSIGRGLASIRPMQRMNKFFSLYLLRAYEQEIRQDSKGTTFDAITSNQLKNLPVKLPPLNEQKRIVAKIEKLFSNLDNSDKYLLHLEKQLKRYRQSVFKSAFEGELTKEWRSRNKYSLDDWQYQTISDLANKIFAGGDKPETVSNVQSKECPYPIYANGLKDNGLYGYTNIYKVEDECITISARGTIGFPLVRNEKFVPIVRLIVVIPKNYVFSKYLKYYIESKIVVQSGSSIPQLTVPMVKQIEILLPKLEEQQEIVNQIEKHFSIIDKLETVVQQSIKESKRLRQSILKQAFEGKLVEQDPNDESAGVLLEKIAKAKEEYQKAMKRKK